MVGHYTEVVTDEELVSRLLARCDELAFSELMERYTEKVHNLALRITRNHEDAEEILQDVFVTVFRKADRFQGKSAFSSWLYRIAANTAFMKLRRRRKHITVSLEELEPKTRRTVLDQPETAHRQVALLSVRHELRHMLEGALDELPCDYRAIFILRDVDGLSNQEVGEILQLSVPAIKSRLHRSRLLLRKKLRRFYKDYRSEDVISVGPMVTRDSGPTLRAA